MPWELVDGSGNRYRLPASLHPAQLHVGGSPRVRFVRGYGQTRWFVVQDGIREPEPIDLVGVLQTDRDEVTIQALLDQLDAAAASAVKLVHLDNYGVPIRQLPLLGALPITTEPDGVDGTFLRVTVPLVPGQADWEAPDESSGPAPIYEYEVFLASGTWDWGAAGQPAEVDVLVLAGGGGGGATNFGEVNIVGRGGGGAGGLVIASGVAVTGNVTVTVGAGGLGGLVTNPQVPGGQTGRNGEDSSFGSVTAKGGGGGGPAWNTGTSAGADGGSGGGAGFRSNSPGSGVAGQGHAGGSANFSATSSGGGGGGGAGGVGGSVPNNNSGGNGGPGVTLESLGWGDAVALGAPPSIGGGGGGGAYTGGTPGTATHGGGSGGGAGFQSGADGQPNTGGGGGGQGGGSATNNVAGRKGGDGGSGLVIVRWVRP